MGAIDKPASRAAAARPRRRRSPTPAQRGWLLSGMDQPGGKLPLFDGHGQKIRPALVEACVAAGWAERWFDNPLKPDWLVCRLTEAGRAALQNGDGGPDLSPATDTPLQTASSS